MTNIFQKFLQKIGLLKRDDSSKESSNYQGNINSNDYNYSNYSQTNVGNVTNHKNHIQTQQMELKNINIKTVDSEKNIDHSKIYDVSKISNKQINTIWDIIKARENTQAEHIINCLPDDEWIDMEDLKNRIKLQYNVEYQNEKSLYPYIKTLTDINLVKVNNSGKKRTWKKNIIIIEKE